MERRFQAASSRFVACHRRNGPPVRNASRLAPPPAPCCTALHPAAPPPPLPLVGATPAPPSPLPPRALPSRTRTGRTARHRAFLRCFPRHRTALVHSANRKVAGVSEEVRQRPAGEQRARAAGRTAVLASQAARVTSGGGPVAQFRRQCLHGRSPEQPGWHPKSFHRQHSRWNFRAVQNDPRV